MKKFLLLITILLCPVVVVSAQYTNRSKEIKSSSVSVKSIKEPVNAGNKAFTVSDPIIYTDEAAFQAALGLVNCVENFDGSQYVTGAFEEKELVINHLPFFNYTMSTTIPLSEYELALLFSCNNAMSYLTTEDSLLITNNGRHINAFGGYIYATDYDGNFISSDVHLKVGNYVDVIHATSTTSFIGYIFSDTIPYIKLTGTLGNTETGVPDSYATIDHFYMGDNLNFQPEIESTIGGSIPEDTPFGVSISNVIAKDVDGDTPLSLTVVSGSNYTFTGNTVTPAANFNGPLQVGVTVSDGMAVSETAYIDVTVTPVNDPPVILSTAPADAYENVLYTYTIVASDPESDPVSYSLSGQPAGMTISSNVISWTPATGVKTSGEVTLTVGDGSGMTDTENFTITVSGLTGIDQKSSETISVWPNPAKTTATIVSPAKIISIQVIDVTGKLILSRNTDTPFVILDEIESMPKGVYFVKVKTTNETKVLKLIKQ